jgi:DnaJ-domain-containing protein 1
VSLALLDGLPRWLLHGLALGVTCSLVVSVLFYLLVRRYPTIRPSSSATRRGEDRRRIELRQYLQAIGEEFAEDRLVQEQRVAFYLPTRNVAITFDPRAYYRIERSTTRAVLVEHEMPATQLGERLPFETPALTTNAAAESGVDAVEAAFAVLGISVEASPEDVRRAYRRKIKDVHPDHGGDQDSFRQVRDAYDTAREHAS